MKTSRLYFPIIVLILALQNFFCSAYILSPGIRSDNALTNIEKPQVIRDDRIRNQNLLVSVFVPKEKDLEEVFFDENNFSAENENLINRLTSLWEKAKETKNVILVQTEYIKGKTSLGQIKSILMNLKDCEPIKFVNYQYNFIKFVRARNRGKGLTTYPKLPEYAYKEEMEPVAANFSMKEIPTLRSIFIFNRECRIDSKDILEIKIETEEILVFKFQNVK